MSVTTPINVDAYVDETTPNANFGGTAKIHLRGSGSSHQRQGFLYVAAPFPLGATVISATLRFYLAESWPSSQTVTAERITQSWKESTLDWNNRPSTVNTNAGTVNLASLSDGDEAEIDLTDMFADVAGGAAYHGVRLKLSTDVMRKIYSSDHSVPALRPQLEVDWSEAPNAPDNLVPGAAQIVSVTGPVVGWQFSDNVGDTSQASSQVQVTLTSDPTFASPSYDSGKEANTTPLWDLGADGFTLASGSSRLWRVRVWDGADLVSDWSDPVEFERLTHGSLTITAPAAPASNFVEETTPPISWTFTTRTQEAYELELFRVPASGPLVSLWHQPKVVSTATTQTVPPGILRTGETYRIRVRVWDDQDRAATPGDLPYVAAERDFTYVRSGTPAAVTALTASPDGAAVVLEWTRSPAPDYFALRVDGVEVDDRLDPADFLVSGSDYAMNYWGAVPRQSHTFEVEAVVDNAGVLQHSDGNATDSAETDPIGVWLADPADGAAVLIAGKEKAAMEIGEIATSLEVLGSRSKVRITDAIRGYEGTFAGFLLDADDRDTFLDLKGRLTELRLIVGDLNIPIVLETVAAIPDKDRDSGYAISFAFFQSGEPTFDAAAP